MTTTPRMNGQDGASDTTHGDDATTRIMVTKITGDVDTASAPAVTAQLAEALHRAASSGVFVLVIDLQGVTYFGSAGLTAVLNAHRNGDDAGIHVRVVAAQTEITRPVEVTSLDQILRMYPTIEQACADNGN